jgi:hypothetical protein
LKGWEPFPGAQAEALSRSEFEVGMGGARGGARAASGGHRAGAAGRGASDADGPPDVDRRAAASGAGFCATLSGEFAAADAMGENEKMVEKPLLVAVLDRARTMV